MLKVYSIESNLEHDRFTFGIYATQELARETVENMEVATECHEWAESKANGVWCCYKVKRWEVKS